MIGLPYTSPKRDDEFLALAVNEQQQSLANAKVYAAVTELAGKVAAGVGVPGTIEMNILTPLSTWGRITGSFSQSTSFLPKWHNRPHQISDVVRGWVLPRCVHTSVFPHEGEAMHAWQDAILTDNYKIVPSSDIHHDGKEYYTVDSNLRPIETSDLLVPESLPAGRQTYLWSRIAEGIQEIDA